MLAYTADVMVILDDPTSPVWLGRRGGTHATSGRLELPAIVTPDNRAVIPDIRCRRALSYPVRLDKITKRANHKWILRI